MNPKILRRRFIPDETVDISNDEILFRDEKVIVTKWEPIKPRKDFAGGMSFAFLDEGYKISRFYGANGEFLYWYIDIIEVILEKESNTYVLIDLLLDVKIFPDGKYIILDEDELDEALNAKKINQNQYDKARNILDKIVKIIDEKKFPPRFITEFLEQAK